jgi:cell division protein FtsQ
MTTAPPAPPGLPPASPPSPTAVRLPIDPRMRQRRIEVRREEGRRRLKLLCILIGGTVAVALGLGITHSQLLAVHHVEVSGVAHTSRAQVVAAAGLGHGGLMVDVDPGHLAERLGQLPWVARAAVSRRWPTTVKIAITERSPVALMAGPPGQLAVIDVTGRVLAVWPTGTGPTGTGPTVTGPTVTGPVPGVGLPTLIGLDPAGPAGSTLPDGDPVRAALALLAAAPRDIGLSAKTWIRTVQVADDGELSAVLNTNITIRLGPIDQLDTKLLALRALLEQVDLKGVATIDLRVPDAPALTRSSRPGTVSTTSRG